MFDPDPLRPPADIIGTVVPLGLDVGTNDEVAMSVSHLTVYPVGFEFGFDVVTKEDPGVICAEEIRLARELDEDPIGLQFHLGVEFADGRRADTFTDWISVNLPAAPKLGTRIRVPQDPATDITIEIGGAGPYDRRYSGPGWVWPLPPEGDLTFWVGWPAAGLPSRPSVIDAGIVLDAVDTAIPIWDEG